MRVRFGNGVIKERQDIAEYYYCTGKDPKGSNDRIIHLVWMPDHGKGTFAEGQWGKFSSYGDHQPPKWGWDVRGTDTGGISSYPSQLPYELRSAVEKVAKDRRIAIEYCTACEVWCMDDGSRDVTGAIYLAFRRLPDIRNLKAYMRSLEREFQALAPQE